MGLSVLGRRHTILSLTESQAPVNRLPFICLASALATLFAVPSGAQAQRRAPAELRWELIGHTPLDFDSPLQYPVLIAGSPDLAFAFDMAGNEIRAVRSDGEIAWTRGGRGGGPQEFSHVTDVEFINGRLWVADRGNARSTGLDPDGNWGPLFTSPDVYQIGAFSDGRLLTLGVLPEVRLYSESGVVLDQLRLPARYQAMNPMAADPIVSSASPAGGVFLVFRYQPNPILISAVGSELAMKELVGPVARPFQEAIHSSRGGRQIIRTPEIEYHRSVSVGSDFFYVLSVLDDESLIVDRYTFAGEYHDSFVPPEPVGAWTVMGEDLFAGLIYEPIPHIKFWRIVR